jgi:hypothetical protein
MSTSTFAAAANANPQPAGSVVLDKMPGGRLMREYESIVGTSASSSSGDDDDDGILIYDNFNGGDDFNGGKRRVFEIHGHIEGRDAIEIPLQPGNLRGDLRLRGGAQVAVTRRNLDLHPDSSFHLQNIARLRGQALRQAWRA